MVRRIVLIVLLTALAAPLSACGRRGSLEPPEGSTYPRTYPADPGAPDETKPKPK